MKKCILTGIAATVLTAGCANTSTNKTNQGAMAGAVGGGLVGGIVGHNTHRFISRPVAKKTTEGIIGGTIIGGVLGALVGYAQDQKARADGATTVVAP